jgi:opacity protein-like surface antigen
MEHLVLVVCKNNIIVRILLSFLLLSSFIYSNEKEYIGIGGMSGVGNQVWDFNSDYGYTHKAVTFKFGIIQKNESRLETAFNTFAIDGDSGWMDVYMGMETNYLYVIPTPIIKPYISCGVGVYISSSMTTYDERQDRETNAQSYSLNLGTGILIEIVKSLELEVSYQYRHFSWNVNNYYINDDMSNIYVGTNFKF